MAVNGSVLVVGGDGAIGSAVAARLEACGTPVVRTSRRGSSKSIPLDLTALPSAWTPPAGVTAAVLCAAVTSNNVCREHVEECRQVNVTATVDLGRRLSAAGVRVVFLSTNMVFDGAIPFALPQTPRCPRTVYGQTKADAEKAILERDEHAAVVRLTKVLGPSPPLLALWRHEWGVGQPVRPLVDLVSAPLTVAFAADAIAAITRSTISGIMQVSATADITYAEMALRLADAWGFSRDLVRPTLASTSGLNLEHVPKHTTLDASEVHSIFGIAPPDPWEAVAAAAQQ